MAGESPSPHTAVTWAGGGDVAVCGGEKGGGWKGLGRGKGKGKGELRKRKLKGGEG